MALLYKQLSPLHGVWKMEESSDELLGMLEHKADYSSFWSGYRQRSGGRNISPAGCF